MDKRAMAQMFGMFLWMTIRSGVSEMYKNSPVISDIISTDELMTMHAELFADMMFALILGKTIEEIREEHKDRIDFIKSVTSKF